MATLGLRLRRHQIRQAFDRGKVEATVLERATRELARLGMPKSVQLSQQAQHRRNHGTSAMDLQLDGVLAGLAVGPRKPERQALIDEIPGGGIAHSRQGRPTRLGHLAGQLLERDARTRTRDPNDRDRRRRAAGGDGEYGGLTG